MAAYHNELWHPIAKKVHFCDGIWSSKPLLPSAGGTAARGNMIIAVLPTQRGNNVFTLIKDKYYADLYL